MNFQASITLTEEDYLAFNIFTSLESTSGKKLIKRSRIVFLSVVAGLMVLFMLILGWTPFSVTYMVLMVIFTLIYTLFYKKMLKRSIKTQIKRLKKTGKLPFDSVTTLEFYEDRLKEITADKHLEQSYSALERICIVEDRYIYLYSSSIGAHILPISQLKAQLDLEAFLGFISHKCNIVEHYKRTNIKPV